MIWWSRLTQATICLVFIHWVLIPVVAQAREDVVPGSRYTSARAAALGDAFLPIGDDGPAALFYNPAAVGKIRKLQAEPLNITMSANGGFVDTAGINSYKVYSLSANQASLQANPGAFESVGASILPSFYGKGFAVGVLLQSEVGASSDSAGNVHYKSLYQFVPAASFGLRLAGGIVRVGYGLQWVNQATGDISVPSGSTLGYNQALLQGSGLSQTAGFALTLPVAYLPSLNLVGRNLMGTSYSLSSIIPFSSNSSGTPATDPMSFDASVSIQPRIDSGLFANIVLEYRDMTNTSAIAPLGRLVGGLEFSVRDFFFLRGGYGSGYPSAGAGLRMKRGEFSFSWFSQEIGTFYHDQRDVRYMLQFQMRAF